LYGKLTANQQLATTEDLKYKERRRLTDAESTVCIESRKEADREQTRSRKEAERKQEGSRKESDRKQEGSRQKGSRQEAEDH